MVRWSKTRKGSTTVQNVNGENQVKVAMLGGLFGEIAFDFCRLTNACTPWRCLTFLHISQYFLRLVLDPRSIGLPQDTHDDRAHI